MVFQIYLTRLISKFTHFAQFQPNHNFR